MLIKCIDGFTRQFGAPADWDGKDMSCGVLPVIDVDTPEGNFMASAWEPTPAEIRAMLAGHNVVLGVRGTSHPVVFLHVPEAARFEEDVRDDSLISGIEHARMLMRRSRDGAENHRAEYERAIAWLSGLERSTILRSNKAWGSGFRDGREMEQILHAIPDKPQEGQALPHDRLKLILNGDPAWLLEHLKENSVFDANLLADVFRLAKERASQLALPAGPVPVDAAHVQAARKALAELHEAVEDCANALQEGEGFEEAWEKVTQAEGQAHKWLLMDAGNVPARLRAIKNEQASPSPAVAQPVADERAEYERMLRAGYQHDNVRRQERGLASTDELTEGQEREIAERVALKFPSGAGLRKDSPVAFSCARRAAHPTSWTMTCDKHCGDDAKCFRAALCQPAEEGGKS